MIGVEPTSPEMVNPDMRARVIERNTTWWLVRYRDPDGAARVTHCFAGFMRCDVYRDEAAGDAAE